MADQAFPQIPAKVWWDMRSILQRTPRAKFDENMLAAQLSVQVAASRQYLAELKKLGILDEEGRSTELANKWRMDDSYPDSVKLIASEVYPDQLVTIAPPGNTDRQTVTNWFMTQGLGEGSARNKAATYVLVTSDTPEEAASGSEKEVTRRRRRIRKIKTPTTKKITTSRPVSLQQNGGDDVGANDDPKSLPLNVNVQIHISHQESYNARI